MSLGIGLIGSGYMGRAHGLSYAAAASLFELPARPRLEVLADVDGESAARAARELGFKRSTGDWRSLVSDPLVDVVDITTPNLLHLQMAIAAIDGGKHVYCEKPLAPTADQAKKMMEAAEAAGVKTMIGLNYLKNPITALAKNIIESGEIGDVIAFRGHHLEDYMADPNSLVAPWRLDSSSGDGVVVDLGSHIVSLARYLVGPITVVVGDRRTVVPERFTTEGEMVAVDVADEMRAVVRFDNGATGTIEVSWLAVGRKMSVACEVRGTRGTLAFDFERLNELYLYREGDDPSRHGFKTILAGPAHPPYGDFLTAPGHQLGFNDLKTIEIGELVEGMVSDGPGPWPDFREGWEVQRVLDGVQRSSAEERPVTIDEV